MEFALVAPILFMLLFGIIVFGFALYQKQSAVHATREGARIGAVGPWPGATQTDICKNFKDLVQSKSPGVTFSKVDVGFGDDGTAGQSGNTVYGTLFIRTHYSVDLTAISWLPGIPAKLNLSETAKSAIEQPLPATIGSGCS